jgi:subtilisin family serine protease
MNFLPVRSLLSAVAVAALALACAVPRLAGSETEPLYFVYHGQQKDLKLDAQHVAVHVKTSTVNPVSSAAKVPAGLISHGFSESDVVARPLSDWMILDAQKTLPAPTTGTSSTASASEAEKGSAIHTVIESLLNSGDATIDFVSPVFRDKRGDPIVLTSTVLIGFKEELSVAEREGLKQSLPEGAQLQKMEFPQPNDQRWQIQSRDGFAVLARANALARIPGVAYAEPDMIVTGHANLVPGDPMFGQSWGLRNTGQSGGQSGFDMKATAAWDITTGSASVIVLVMDSGIQQNHPDINQVQGKDFTTDFPSNQFGGPFGPNDNHGTWVAGCISGKINNSLGTTGIAPGVKVASARCGTAYQNDGSFFAQESWFADALYWGQSIGARVSNNSNGFDSVSNAVDSAYASTRAAGMIHFAAAGNSGDGFLGYPANSASVNAVGAATRYGGRAWFSQYGPGLKYLAPGSEIYTTDRTGFAGGATGDYLIVDGTSFASPYAAGVAALIISQNPNMTVAQVENQLQASCLDMGLAGYDTGYGYGMIDAFRALTTTPPPTPTPTPSPTATPTATPAPGRSNILVSIGSAGTFYDQSNIVREFTSAGVLVRTIPFNYNNAAYYPNGENLRDVVVDRDGFIDAFNGTFAPFLTRYSGTSNTYSHSSFPDWSTLGGGGIASYENFIYVSDMDGANQVTRGIIRFDTSTNTAVRYATDANYHDLNMGLDGKLYGLFSYGTASPIGVNVFDPVTMALLRQFFLPENIRARSVQGIAVDQTGDIFLTSGGVVFRLNSSGAVEASLDIGFALSDIDIDETGFIIIAQFDGRVVETDRDLTAFTSFQAIYNPDVQQWSMSVAFAHAVPTAPRPSRPLNVSTRLRVETGDSVMIGGFIINGNAWKKVIIRATGPSLAQAGVTDFLSDPVLELHDSTGSLIVRDDNWKDLQESQIQATGLAPHSDLESAIVATLSPGGYTAIVSGKDGVVGLGLVEVYDLNQSTDSKLANISTRGFVQTGDNVMIGGFILGGSSGNSKVIVRVIGPSLAPAGITNPLLDPILELHNGNGALLSQNDDWQNDQQQAISDTGLAPSDLHESAILATLLPGTYTVIVQGKNGTSGVALVEVYNLSN